MTSACIHLPSFCFAHSPELDQAIITGRDDQGQCRVERDPVDATVVALEHKLDNGICVAKHVGLIRVGAGHLIFESHRGGSRVLLAQAGDVPDADRLIEGSRNDEILLGVKLSTHGVVVVASHGADYDMWSVDSITAWRGDFCRTQRAVLPVPDADGLII